MIWLLREFKMSLELTPEQQAEYDQLESDYPCDKRSGFAHKGCSCDGGKEVDTGRVKCPYLGGNVKIKNCFDCPHQKAYLRFLSSRETQ